MRHSMSVQHPGSLDFQHQIWSGLDFPNLPTIARNFVIWRIHFNLKVVETAKNGAVASRSESGPHLAWVVESLLQQVGQ